MKTFFVLALGRSGTRFLSALLATDSRGVVHHEPRISDCQLLALRHAGTFDAVADALLEQRFRELLPPEGSVEFYGEVNSYLRYEIDWLSRRFAPPMIHLVRDGRAFVRSVWERGVYDVDEIEPTIVPRDTDPYSGRWGELSRFERLCWYWAHTNDFLASRLEHRVRFEDLLDDYACFEEQVLAPTGVRVSRERWRQEIGRPKNTSAAYRTRNLLKRWVLGKGKSPTAPLPPWTEWDASRTEQFWSICGETMERLGYRREAARG